MRDAVNRAVDRGIDLGDRIAAWGDRLLRGRGIRRTWLVVAVIAAVPLLVLSTGEAASVLAHEERTEVIEVDAADLAALDVDNSAGTVTVVGVDGATEVTIRARISDGLRDTGLDARERDGRLVVTGDCPLLWANWCRADLTIEVPAAMHVGASGQGRVAVSDVSGGVTARSDQGGVELVRVGGTVVARSDQGRIDGSDLTATSVDARADQGRLTLGFARSPDAVTARADQGNIDIVLPDEAGVDYATEVDADQGAVSAPIRQDPDSRRSITAHADQGSITVTYASG